MSGNDPLEAYAVWRKGEQRKARAWAALGWLAILAGAIVSAAVIWIVVGVALVVLS